MEIEEIISKLCKISGFFSFIAGQKSEVMNDSISGDSISVPTCSNVTGSDAGEKESNEPDFVPAYVKGKLGTYL